LLVGRKVKKGTQGMETWSSKIEAAQQGDAEAQYNLGLCYLTGNGVSQDYVEAIQWITKAAEQGYASAEFMLGLHYANGDGVRKSAAEAAKWYTKAAEQGDVDAQFSLG